MAPRSSSPMDRPVHEGLNHTLPLPLLIRVDPRPDEALLSILVRASQENVLGRLHRVASLAHLEKHRVEYLPFTAVQASESLAALLGVDEQLVSMRMHPKAAHSSADEYIDWYGTVLPRRYVETRRIRFGNAGVEDFVRAQWAIRPLSFCPETGDILRHSCPSCGVDQVWAKVRESTLR